MTPKSPAMFSDGNPPKDSDIVIALMGMTGSGKSSLIRHCTGKDVEIGHNLKSCTQSVQTYTFEHPKLPAGRVFLVDTPGFDDSNRSDTEVLRNLAAWLTATYSSGFRLSSILYLHRINQTRMQGSALKNILLFRSLCGDAALSKVVLVTTMWDIEEPRVAEDREAELKNTTKFWGGMVAKGSRVLRHNNTQQSAFALIETFLKSDSKIVLDIQDEMVNNKKPLDKTKAGKDVEGMLAEQNRTLKQEIRDVESKLQKAIREKDEELAEIMRDLKLDHRRALQEVMGRQERLQATMQQLYESKFAQLEAKSREETQKWQQQPRSLSLDHAHQSEWVFTKLVQVDTTGNRIWSARGTLISPDGSYIVAGTGWGDSRPAPGAAIYSTKTGQLINTFYTRDRPNAAVSPLAFFLDERTIVFSCDTVLYKADIRKAEAQNWLDRFEMFVRSWTHTPLTRNMETTIVSTDSGCSLFKTKTGDTRSICL